ncbi:asparagine synthase (glutamine-hydrolyzing) [Amylibacter sp.]|nr:asparagine synthase (glutamine-hydrolyzing) [Amylibacter sp.]
MCGILGSFGNPGDSEAIVERVKLGLDKLRHRGPNGSGLKKIQLGNYFGVLAHSRLSIIDLSTASAQPMVCESGRWVISFNGEIYNYRELRAQLKSIGVHFKTSGDTEVLLAAWRQWGVQCLDKIDGMFSFAILDTFERRLFLVRDPYGIKPLFYRLSGGKLDFSSEMSALLCQSYDRARLNESVSFDFIAYSDYDCKRNTFVEDVYRVEPGCYLDFDITTQNYSLKRWWKPSISQTSSLSYVDSVDFFRTLFLESVQKQLRSDVPIGAALSGGVDSSAIVCAIKYLEPEIDMNTYTFDSMEAKTSEMKWANLVNECTGFTNKVVSFPKGLDIDHLDAMITSQGEPVAGASMFANRSIYEAAKKDGVKVVLEGQGADELVSGYRGYLTAQICSAIGKGEFFDLVRLVRSWSSYPGNNKKDAMQALVSVLAERYLLRSGKFSSNFLSPYWLEKNTRKFDWFHRLTRHGLQSAPSGRALMHTLRNAQTTGSLEKLLRHSDRNAMEYSIENRVPFLSRGLSELIFSLPEKYLIAPDGTTKRILRDAMKGIVPDEILVRKDKIGFVAPENTWITPELKNLRKWYEPLEMVSFIKFDSVNKRLNQIENGDLPFSSEMYRLMNLGRWMQKFL